MKVQFDESTPNKQVRFFVENVDFFTALKLAGEVSKTMWAALSEHQMFIAADNAENHRLPQLHHDFRGIILLADAKKPRKRCFPCEARILTVRDCSRQSLSVSFSSQLFSLLA